MGRRTESRLVRHLDPGRGLDATRPDVLVAEEPLEMRVAGNSLGITMRTPGDDHDLMLGFLLTEGVIRHGDEVRQLRYCAGRDADGVQRYNRLDALLDPAVPVPEPSRRHRVAAAGCGMCGKDSLDDVLMATAHPPATDPCRLSAAVLATLPQRLREQQTTFDATGAVHAAGLFDAGGTPIAVREDIGRHNAVDKVIGAAMRAGRVPGPGLVLVVSARAGFEIVQKAVMAGVVALIAVSAPSSLSVDLARGSGMLLGGFARDGAFNLYAGDDRLDD